MATPQGLCQASRETRSGSHFGNEERLPTPKRKSLVERRPSLPLRCYLGGVVHNNCRNPVGVGVHFLNRFPG